MDKLIFGDSEGGITICNQLYGLSRFIAYEHGVNFVYQVVSWGRKSVFQCKNSNLLYTIGNGKDLRPDYAISESHKVVNDYRAYLSNNDHYSFILEDLFIGETVKTEPADVVHSYVLKVWNLSKMEINGVPQCVRTIQLFERMEEQDITVFSVGEEEQLLLFGCSNGRIFYVQVRHLTSLQAIGRHDSHSLHDAEHASAEIHRLHNRSPPGLHTRRIFFSPLRFLVGSRHHRHLRVLDDKNRLFFVQPKRPGERGVSAARRHPRLRAELQLHQRPQRAGNTIPPMRSRFWRSTRAFVSFPRGDWKRVIRSPGRRNTY